MQGTLSNNFYRPYWRVLGLCTIVEHLATAIKITNNNGWVNRERIRPVAMGTKRSTRIGGKTKVISVGR